MMSINQKKEDTKLNIKDDGGLSSAHQMAAEAIVRRMKDFLNRRRA